MSYEGYVRRLCAQGHHHAETCPYDDFPEHCPVCGADWAWEQSIDETNGAYDEEHNLRLDGYFDLEIRIEAPTCPNCGAETGHARYWIPLHCGRRLRGHPYGDTR